MQKDFASESTRSYDKNFSFGIVQLPKEHGSVDIIKNNQHIVDCFLSFIYLQNCIQEIFSFILPITLLGHALDRLVSVSSIHYCTSTSDLSTSSSSRGLTTYVGISHLEGGFTLRCLQRLSRPGLATLPCTWYATDTPAASPSRSSRTKDSSSQISYAHAG